MSSKYIDFMALLEHQFFTTTAKIRTGTEDDAKIQVNVTKSIYVLDYVSKVALSFVTKRLDGLSVGTKPTAEFHLSRILGKRPHTIPPLRLH
jgi:hypothetical protein